MAQTKFYVLELSVATLEPERQMKSKRQPPRFFFDVVQDSLVPETHFKMRKFTGLLPRIHLC